MPIDLILRDLDIAELYIADKIERVAANQLLKTLADQLEDILPEPIKRGFLADDVMVGPLENPAFRRVLDASGAPKIRHLATGEERPVFPATFNVTDYVTVNHTIDRGSTGATLLHFAMDLGLLWDVSLGPIS